MALEYGRLFGPYRLDELVGKGGLAEVWRAFDTRSGRVVAVKRFTGALTTRDSEQVRADMELLAAHALRGHPNVVEVFGGGAEPAPHVVMEFMDAGDLRGELTQHGRLTVERTLDVGHAVAGALAAAANAGIVHGDIKPSNILLGSDGSIKLGDFNVARVVGYSGGSISGTVLSFDYAAPEVWDGKPSAKSDLYAFGCVLFECLVGRPPFSGTYTEVFRAHLEQAPDLDALPPSSPRGLRALIGQLLAKDPLQRPADARIVLQRLEAIGKDVPAVEAFAAGAMLPAAIGQWVLDGPHPTTPWAWRARSKSSGEEATIELFFGDASIGDQLRRAVAINERVTPFGAERLIETNRLLLRPNESFGRPTPPGWTFWVARDEKQPAGAVALDRAGLGRAVAQLSALQAAAASVRLPLDLSPDKVVVLDDGSVHVVRPGLPGGNTGAATTSALAALHALAAPDLRPLVAGAASLDALALAVGAPLPATAAGFDAPTVFVPGGPPPLAPDPGPQRTTILRRPAPAATAAVAVGRRRSGAALIAPLLVAALVVLGLLAVVLFNNLSSRGGSAPTIFGGIATDSPAASVATPEPSPSPTASPALSPATSLAPTPTLVPTPTLTPIPTATPIPIPTQVPTLAPTDPPQPTNPPRPTNRPPRPTDPPPQPTNPPPQAWRVDISASDDRVNNGERVRIRATSNRPVTSTPFYIQVFNPENGFVHWSCKVGTSCGGGARRENITAAYQARISNSAGGNVQAQSERITVTWEPGAAPVGWSVDLQVSRYAGCQRGKGQYRRDLKPAGDLDAVLHPGLQSEQRFHPLVVQGRDELRRRRAPREHHDVLPGPHLERFRWRRSGTVTATNRHLAVGRGLAVTITPMNDVPTGVTAEVFEARLEALRSADGRIGMGKIFALAKEDMAMDPGQIERLLESPVHEVRVGAVSVMDWQARSKKTTAERRRELFELYIRRHDRINTWDLVDRSAIWVVGDYLVDKPRDVLYRLARSKQPMERRTAILSTFAFIRRGDVDDAIKISELLANDGDDLVQKAVGWMLREVGKKDPQRHAAFLDAHAATMPRVMLRYAIEKLPAADRTRYMSLAKSAG